MSIYKGTQLLAGTQDNRANTDLSNISATGQAKFDAKVNKSGDTITGTLTSTKIDSTGKNAVLTASLPTDKYVDICTATYGVNNYRCSTLRFFNWATYHETLLGVHNYNDGAPEGLSIRCSSSNVFSCDAHAGVKNSIINWVMPNYSAGISVSSGYTAPKHGYIFGYMVLNNSNFQAWINGAEVCHVWNYDARSMFVPIGKGQKFTYQNAYSGSYFAFFPCTGAS